MAIGLVVLCMFVGGLFGVIGLILALVALSKKVQPRNMALISAVVSGLTVIPFILAVLSLSSASRSAIPDSATPLQPPSVAPSRS